MGLGRLLPNFPSPLHRRFGYAPFYRRRVAAAKDSVDKVPGKLTARVTSAQIYWGAVPFVIVQVLMVALVIAFPDLVGGGLAKKAAVNTDKINIVVPQDANPADAKAQESLENELDKALTEDKPDATQPAPDPKPGDAPAK